MTQSTEDLDSTEYGLKEDWNLIQKTLEDIIPVYDKTNRYISLGSDLKIRKRGIALLRKRIGKDDFLLLDLGCGTGKMTQFFQQVGGAKDSSLLVDPIPGMMQVARSRTGSSGLLAVYEHLPLRENSADAAMAGFSLRDAQDLPRALGQLNKVLRTDGWFLIVDLSKPDSNAKSALISFYWRTLAPFLAFLSSGRVGLKFAALSKTYNRLPRRSDQMKLFHMSGFKIVQAEFFMMGGASIILLRKSDEISP